MSHVRPRPSARLRAIGLLGPLLVASTACSIDASEPTRSTQLAVGDRLAIEPDSAFARQLSLVRSYSGIERAERRVIRDPVSWEAFWRRAVRMMHPSPAAPAVDWSKHMVVVVAVGLRPTGGHTVFVDAVEAGPRALRVEATSASPGRDCVTTDAMTAPLDAVLVRRVEGDVDFDVREVVLDCR